MQMSHFDVRFASLFIYNYHFQMVNCATWDGIVLCMKIAHVIHGVQNCCQTKWNLLIHTHRYTFAVSRSSTWSLGKTWPAPHSLSPPFSLSLCILDMPHALCVCVCVYIVVIRIQIFEYSLCKPAYIRFCLISFCVVFMLTLSTLLLVVVFF